jgi:DUF1009 family protein
MGRRWQKVGILAGGGALPGQLVAACEASGAPFYVVRLKGYADETLAGQPGVTASLGEVGRIIRQLKKEGCDAVCMAGVVRRPNFAGIKPDWRGAALLPRVIQAARRGDGALLDVLVETFSAEGFVVVGAEEVATGLHATAGGMTAKGPSPTDLSDIRKAAALIAAIGPFDVGQAAVVRDGFVVAIEAAEGTDLMLDRCAGLRARDERSGVLVKRPKPEQERRVDLPTIGVRTVEKAEAAGLNGIAIEAEAALILDREAVIREAKRRGLFVYAFTKADLKAT